MTDFPRLIENAFCLKEASLDSAHEKSVRHGHISTLHIWPARRPLAACRAALIATLLPDPGNAEERRKILQRLGGRVTERVEKKVLPGGKKVDKVREETVGGILHWGRESGPDMGWFRDEIKKVYGRAPRVLDPFAGGGAIPLEAMRLGCEATAIDINPVAWFILKCTLEYPQKLAGKTLPLPEFALRDEEFMDEFRRSSPRPKRKRAREGQKNHLLEAPRPQTEANEADLAWQVRAWGRWVLKQARKDLARFYPTYAEYQAISPGARPVQERGLRLVPIDDDGNPRVEQLNAGLDDRYLSDPRNARWVAKPTVAYLWARTVTCKNCRATVPLLKTRWLCKKDKKRVSLTMEPNPSKTAGVTFGVQHDVPVVGSNAAQRREHDKRIGAGTMSRSGATCPCCGTIMTMQDMRLEGQARRLGVQMTAVVVEGLKGKEYRLPVDDEIRVAAEAASEVDEVFSDIPFGAPNEPLPSKEALGFRVPLYGFDQWSKLFTPRQILSLGTFVKHTRAIGAAMDPEARAPHWTDAVTGYLSCSLDKLADYISALCTWHVTREVMSHVFVRYALPMTWDLAELNPLSEASGNYLACVEWVCRVISHCLEVGGNGQANVRIGSAVRMSDHVPDATVDLVVTDPPYYDAIPYSDLMDFFYVWLRRSLAGLGGAAGNGFKNVLSPKWDAEANDGELIDDASRHGGDKVKSRQAYEDGMLRAFQACHRALRPEGRMVVVFANKQAEAWESLVSAVIRARFVVVASWPIQTEMGNRTRALSSAALSSSVWLVCKKRAPSAGVGWDSQVLDEMKERLYGKPDEQDKAWVLPPCLHEYWDAGLRGPDFVWAATGPALEAYSKHPVVKKADRPGEVMSVAEFLKAVRRLVVDFVVGRVLSGDGAGSSGGLDDVTTYYLLHRHDFGFEEAPAGACILYSVSCGLSDRDLTDQHDILRRVGSDLGASEEDAGDAEPGTDEGESDESEIKQAGASFILKPWSQRGLGTLGQDQEGRPAPLIDKVHRLMRLWKGGDVARVNDYLDENGLVRSGLFQQLLQALIELATSGSEERSILESISNHLVSRGAVPRTRRTLVGDEV
jgi:adenine-specific DNA methylase